MEVEHEFHPRVLDLLPQSLDVFQVLSYALSFLLLGSLGGVYEEAHAHGVHALLLEKSQWIGDGLALVVIILRSVLHVRGQQRDVSAHEAFLRQGWQDGCQRKHGE